MQEITALIDRDRKVIMDWSPKTGCTIAVKMFFRNMGLLEKALEFDDWIHEYRMHVYQLEYPIYKEDLENPEFYKFKVVRNPYSRAVSSYIHTMRWPEMHAPIQNVMKRRNANISFNQFLDFLSRIDLDSCDPHYRLQKKEFEGKIKNCFQEIVKLENLEEGIKRVNKAGNFGFDLTGLSSSHHIDKNENLKGEFMNKRWRSIKSSIPSYKHFYNTETLDKVGKLYKEDLEEYNYNYEETI